MKVLVLNNGIFIEKEIDNTLESLQREVEGYIEIPFLSEKLNERRIDMIINEEGKMIDGLKIEIMIVAPDGKVIDVIYGNVIFTSNDDEGNTIGLTEEQIDFIKQELKQKVIMKEDHTIRLLWV